MKNAKPTHLNAIKAQCHECMGWYQDGRRDCECVKCSLYTWMPYRQLEPNMSWITVNPKRRGKVRFADIETKDLGNLRKKRAVKDAQIAEEGK